MTLASHALELIRVLRSVLDALDRYDTDQRRDYARSLGDRLRPLVAAFEVAVVSERSRSHAEHILSEITEVMRDVNGAATRGEMRIFEDDTLNRFWDLSTLFRESGFSGQSL